jgi:hypothetical protein
MIGVNTARTFVIGQVLLMVVTYLPVFALSDLVSDRGDLALQFTWAALVVMGATAFITTYLVHVADDRRPHRLEDAASICELRGIVAADTDTFEGPDGRPCVAAIRVDPSLGSQNRWIPFTLEVAGEEVRVRPDDADTIIARSSATSWTRVAARPRSFGRGAWAPQLVDETRFDWVCVRPGDYVQMRDGDLRWGLELARDETSSEADTATQTRTLILQAGESSEWRGPAFEIIHPRHDLAWRKRQMIRTAVFVCRSAVGIALLWWMLFAFEGADLLAPLPWLLFALAVTVVIPVFAAYAAAWHRLSPWDASPPSWCRDPTADSVGTPYRRSGAEESAVADRDVEVQ